MSFTKQFLISDEEHLNTEAHIDHVDESGLPAASPKDYQATFAAAIGLNTTGMVEVITHDLKRMIDKEQRFSLEGYIQCLYRIMSRKVAWECITEAYGQKNEPIPAKIKMLFGQKDDIPQKKLLVAE